jgi:CelD/BcsL family acetyltransferase involved in cellulose biosynthesis
MRVELTDDPTAFRTQAWNDLVLADPFGSFFHTPEYLKLWWEEFGAGNLVIARVFDADVPIAACCLQVEGTTLGFLGGYDVTDYMGPVGEPGVADAASKELAAVLRADLDWARADLRGMPAGSPWFDALAEAFGSLGLRVDADPDGDGLTPILRLPASFDAYLAALPSKLRHEMRRKQRRLAALPGGYSVSLADDSNLAERMDRFIELHKSSPGPKGKFMRAGMEIFFRRLGESFHAPHVFHLASLEVDGTLAAGIIGFVFRDTFFLYNSAFDREFAQLSPGMVLIADAIRGAIEEGRAVFDLLKGDVDYKRRFGPDARSVGRLVVER